MSASFLAASDTRSRDAFLLRTSEGCYSDASRSAFVYKVRLSDERVCKSGLRYLVTVPPHDASTSSKKTHPLLLHLHGAACRGLNFEGFDRSRSSAGCCTAGATEHGFILVRPQCPPGKEWTTPSLRMALADLLDELLFPPDGAKKLPIDDSRLLLSGASMGGDGAWALAGASELLMPFFAAVVPICAGLNYVPILTINDDVSVWVWHGVHDAVYPVSDADKMVEALRERGKHGEDATAKRVKFSRLEHCETPDGAPHAVGHAAWLDAFARDSPLWVWLKAQRHKQDYLD